MLKYIVKRCGQAFIVLIGVTLVTFLLLNVIPGDPVAVMLDKNASPQAVENLRHEWGLDQPLPVQYVNFVLDALRGIWETATLKRCPFWTCWCPD